MFVQVAHLTKWKNTLKPNKTDNKHKQMTKQAHFPRISHACPVAVRPVSAQTPE